MWQTEKYRLEMSACHTELLYFFQSYFMFNVQTINCMQYNSKPVVLNSIIKLGRNHAIK